MTVKESKRLRSRNFSQVNDDFFLEIAIFLEQNHIFALQYVTHFLNFSGHFDGSGENLTVATVINCFFR